MITSKLKLLSLFVLISFSPIDLCNAEETPLMWASAEANITEMQMLIKTGACVNDVAWRDQPHGGKPVLRYAIDSGSLRAVQILLEAGASPHNFTESPIIKDGDDKRANVRNLSLLSHAINSGAPIAIIQELITHGAHIDGSPKIWGDWSALMVAAYRGNKEAVILLLQAGADKSAINSMDNKTALDYAQEMQHLEIAKILEV